MGKAVLAVFAILLVGAAAWIVSKRATLREAHAALGVVEVAELRKRDETIAARDAEIVALLRETAVLRGEVKSLAEANGSLADSKRQKEELEQLHRQLAKGLQSLVDAGSIELTHRHGRLVLAMQSEVLFDPGKAEVRPEGKKALVAVAEALRSIKGRRFQVSGHTDSSPIRNDRFASNWDLSAERAVEVVRLLVDEKVPAQMLSGAGYAEFEPVAPNGTAAGRAKNRRIEISHEPDLAAVAALPQLKVAAGAN